MGFENHDYSYKETTSFYDFESLTSKDSIKEASKAERCDVSIDTLKSGIKIENKDAFHTIKSFLFRNNIFDLTNVNYSDMSYNGSKFILKLSQNGSEIGVYYDNGVPMGNIQNKGKFIKGNILLNTLNHITTFSSNNIAPVTNSDFNEFECNIIEEIPAILEVKEEQKSEPVVIQPTEEANTRIEPLKNEEYTVQKGDILIKIIKKKYGLKMKQSIIDAVKNIVDYNSQHRIDLSKDTNPEDGISGDELKIGQTIYLPQNNEIEEIQNNDKIRRYETNKAKNIKMKQSFIDEVKTLIAKQTK